ncbi:YgfZ/GcvT domain-containing protein [Undibacterium sp. Dicai25W]|uniref:CAF17-like 4Fe-4S cluster assembly/insertion protein YgfZ n=1 Tax=Undibacterium sp. Dicai25W TaxID=3413034 RepID=UPI003BF034B7
MSQNFFTEQQIELINGKITGLTSIWNTPTFASGYITIVADSGLILATGDDAASFLHNQLSNDFEHLNTEIVRRAAYCTAKGRMLASLLYWKTEDGITLQLPKELQPAIQRRLTMFILRAKAKLADVSDQSICFGIGGAQANASLHKYFPTLPALPNTKISNQFGTLIRFHNDGQNPRYEWICPIALASGIWLELKSLLQVTNTDDWYLAEIEAGVPHITARTQEKFVPQMINFELIGGVNFRKGCYPGQEIVARSQYLGKLKRRMALAEIASSELTEGTEVFNETDSEQSCGLVVNIASIDAHRSLALVEMTLADQEQGGIHYGSPDGPVVKLLPLPYEITDITR